METNPPIPTRPGHCEKHGDFTQQGIELFGKITWRHCPACTKEEVAAEEARRAEEQARAERDRQAMIEIRFKTAGIPARFRDRTLANYHATTPEQIKALEAATEFLANFAHHRKVGTSPVFSGNPGTGKSHLAIAILKEVMATGTGMYLNVLDMVRIVRDTWKRTGPSETDVLNMLGTLDLLVLDEVGVQYGTEGEQVILFDVLNRRYRDCRPTILLTNLKAKEFEEYVGPRVFDRLKEGGVWQRFSWESFRGRR